MNNIRKATNDDLERIAEIEIFNYRLNFFPIFKDDDFYFYELTVSRQISKYDELIDNIFVYDDGVVKGFLCIDDKQIKKLFVEPILQGKGIGAKLLEFSIQEKHVNYLWALEKNEKGIKFYQRHGFVVSNEKKLEEDTTEYLVKLVLK